MLQVTHSFQNTHLSVMERWSSPVQELPSREGLTSAGVCPCCCRAQSSTLLTSRLSLSLCLRVSLSRSPPSVALSQCNKSRHVPAGHQQPGWEAAPGSEREEQKDQTGGNPEKNTQDDSALLANTALTQRFTRRHYVKVKMDFFFFKSSFKQ